MPTPAVNTTITFTNVANEFALAINPPSRAMGANFRFASGTYSPASPAIPTGGSAAIRLSGDLGGRTRVTGLYTWPIGTGYTFTASTIGATTGAGVPTGYTGMPFYPTYVVMPQAGYQYLTIGNTGNYTIRVAGAAGSPSGPGRGGSGAILQATSSLSQGQVLIICCGQVGRCNLGISGGGGGGMSAVFGGATLPWIVAAGGGGAAGPGTGSPPAVFNAPNASTTFFAETTPSANGSPLFRSAGSGAQTSVAASAGQPLWSVGLINSSGTRLGGNGSTALAGSTDGGWGGAGNGGGGAGDGGSGGGWIGGDGVPGKTPGKPGLNMIRSTLGTRQYIGQNPSSPTGAAGTAATNGYVIITRNS